MNDSKVTPSLDSLTNAAPECGEMMTLYHHTTPEAAVSIMSERRMTSSAPVDMPYAFFSTRLHGKAAGDLHYGAAAVQVRVPIAITQIDERFRDGECYVKIRLEDLKPPYFVRLRLSESDRVDICSQADVAAELSASNKVLGPSLPGYHWHSVVHSRGWEQPCLDGGNGGQPSSFCASQQRANVVPSAGVAREQLEPPRARQSTDRAPRR